MTMQPLTISAGSAMSPCSTTSWYQAAKSWLRCVIGDSAMRGNSYCRPATHHLDRYKAALVMLITHGCSVDALRASPSILLSVQDCAELPDQSPSDRGGTHGHRL